MASVDAVLIVDNGASVIKIGMSSGPCSSIPNSIAKAPGARSLLVADQIDEHIAVAGMTFRTPFEKGILVDWEVEREIWDRAIPRSLGGATPADLGVVITEPMMNLPQVGVTMDQLLFEEQGFHAVLRCNAPLLATWVDAHALFGNPAEWQARKPHGADAMLVLDVGFSATHAVPIIAKRIISRACKRLNVGGKLLTNMLKETVSFRQWNMMDETVLINRVKEECCYVTEDVYRDLGICKQFDGKNEILQEYVLPDFSSVLRGFVRDRSKPRGGDEQILRMNNERFQIPEILFNPSDIGIMQAGVAELIQQSIEACPEEIQPMLWANILVIGGSSKFPGFQSRLETEVRSLAPVDAHVRIAVSKDPQQCAWHGGARFAEEFRDVLQQTWVTKNEYDEQGGWRIAGQKFAAMFANGM